MKTSRTSKLLETLNAESKLVISELLELGYKAGLKPQLHSAYRSPAEQDAIHAQGRSKPGKIATNAKGTPIPQSIHCYKCAVDTHFETEPGVADWDAKKYAKLWELAVEAGLDKKGLRWAGNWQSFKELAHFEVSHGKTWQEFAKAAGYKIDVPVQAAPVAPKPAAAVPKPIVKAPAPSTDKTCPIPAKVKK